MSLSNPTIRAPIFLNPAASLSGWVRLTDGFKIPFFAPSRARLLAAALLGLGIVSASNGLAGEYAYRAEPSLAAAGKYLEARAGWWMSWKNAQREHGTACMSCHTSVPFMLAEAVLSQNWPQTNAGPRVRLVESVRKRTATWDAIQSYHGSKEHRTKATESILNAAILACEDIAEGRQQPSGDTREAFAHLWALQITAEPRRGAWEWYDYNLPPWEARSECFGAALAAAAAGIAPGYRAGMSADEQQHLAMLRTYLRKNIGVQDLHQRLSAVWASTKLPDLLSEEQRELVVKDALAIQNLDGGWSAGGLGVWKRRDGEPQAAASDGYGTALVVASLKAVVKGKQRGALERGLTWLRKHQRADDGSWPAGSLNTVYAPGDPAGLFMRDAATGWAVLALEN